MITARVRSIASRTCFALGAIWAVAGAMKMIFGVAITFPLLPPLALDQIDVPKSLLTAIVWCVLGALVGRLTPVRERRVREPVRAP